MKTLMAAWAAIGLTVGDPPVTDVSVVPSDGRTEIVVEVDGTVDYRDFTMEGPDRLVLDLEGARKGLPADHFEDLNLGGVEAITARQHGDETVRLTFELEGPQGYSVVTEDGFVRISLENPGGAFEPWTASMHGGDGPERLADPEDTPSPEDAPPPEEAQPAQDVEAAASEAVHPAGQGNPDPEQVLREEAEQLAAEVEEPEEARISVSFSQTPMEEVLFAFSEYSDRSIVPGSGIDGTVSADIRDQPWDIALLAILESHGLAAREMEPGIIRVDDMSSMSDREDVEPLYTRTFRVSYAEADELSGSVESLLSDRGEVEVNESTNSLVVTDISRVLDSVDELIGSLDLRTPQITISAEIVFVSRTELSELGVSYDLKDSQGSQLRGGAPNLADLDGDGELQQTDDDVISLGGNSIAALGNAEHDVLSPSLSVVTSLIMGRHTLVSFIDALEQMQLSDVQARPQVSVLDNQTAEILVGERTPIRVIDAGTPGEFQAAQATVDIEETGIMLEVTPHVTAGDLILMNLRAERSSVDELPEADLGFVFRTQEAETRVLVRDGETVALGGLTVTELLETRSGIPLLKDLPVLGRFFSMTSEETEQQDLMILVTPNIDRSLEDIESGEIEHGGS